MCGRYRLPVSLYVCGRESTRMECHGDPQFVQRSGGWNGVKLGASFLFCIQKKAKFHDLVIYYFSMFSINPWLAENSRAKRTSIISNAGSLFHLLVSQKTLFP